MGSTISQWPAGERPRERLLEHGATALTDTELLALLLGHGARGRSAVEVARSLLSRLGGMRGVLNAPLRSLCEEPGVGPGKAAALHAARECASRNISKRLVPGQAIATPADASQFMVSRLQDRPHEVFCCLYLDNRHRVLAFEELFRGTIDSTTVHPREVVRQAIGRNAAAVIAAHNHPSGVAEPSQADRLITRRLRDALDLIDVRLLDHLVVGDGLCISLAGRGML
jgi:DNA repair protein RadC